MTLLNCIDSESEKVSVRFLSVSAVSFGEHRLAGVNTFARRIRWLSCSRLCTMSCLLMGGILVSDLFMRLVTFHRCAIIPQTDQSFLELLGGSVECCSVSKVPGEKPKRQRSIFSVLSSLTLGFQK